ncbi:MAG: radical SAM protein [Methanosarcinaceae archaeon]|nr:radical SAM protein [Methanosarcinaceae archaeon]
MFHVSKFQESFKDNRVICRLCPHNCKISPDKSGICKVRINNKGELYSKIYGTISSAAVDPIEKKPLYHFFPGTSIYSIGNYGCNLKCVFCQNWEISQPFESIEPDPFDSIESFDPFGSIESIESDILNNETQTPKDIIKKAIESGSNSIAFTYNEPTVWYEFVYDTAVLSKKHGIKTVMVTNGYINEEPLEKLIEYIDAFALDIKGFTNEFYKKYTGGELSPVLKSAESIYKSGAHIEIIMLIIPGLNDDPATLNSFFKWISKNLSNETPIHLNAFHPDYKMQNITPTSYDSLKEIAKSAKKSGLKHVYIGNVRNVEPEFKNTYCPKCNNLLIKRNGYDININATKDFKDLKDFRDTKDLKDTKNESEENMICPSCGYKLKTIIF